MRKDGVEKWSVIGTQRDEDEALQARKGQGQKTRELETLLRRLTDFQWLMQ